MILKDNFRAKLCTIVKRILLGHYHPPDKQEQAIVTILHQAELFTDQRAE